MSDQTRGGLGSASLKEGYWESRWPVTLWELARGSEEPPAVRGAATTQGLPRTPACASVTSVSKALSGTFAGTTSEPCLCKLQ